MGAARLGGRAEDVAADYLVARGFSLFARNVRVGSLEIDIVARQGALMAIVEVRTRGAGSHDTALSSITSKKRERILRAADSLWRKELSAIPGIERVRIDVAAVAFEGAAAHIEYIEGAFVAG